LTEHDHTDIKLIQQALTIDFDLGVCDNRTALLKRLAAHINHLIQADFNRLVAILYRLDISESKLRNTLQENTGKDAGELMAELIVERQIQKLQSRSQYRAQDDIPDDEKW
jgi:hypothetical protein